MTKKGVLRDAEQGVLRDDKEKGIHLRSVWSKIPGMPKPEYDFFVYILASRSHQFYVGFSNSLMRRMAEHREHRPGSYTARYRIDRLVYYEHHQYVINAIHREKIVKKLSRARKIALIESINPTWQDLSLKWDDPEPVRCGELRLRTADLSAALRDDKKGGAAR